MADAFSNNLQLIQMATGTASGTWGSTLNSAMIALVDAALGDTQDVTVASSDVTLTMSQRQHLAFNFTGTISANLAVKLPFNANSTTVAVGGLFEVINNSTGSFAITVKTVASGSTGVEVPQGVRTLLYSNGTNVYYADDAQVSPPVYNGDPNGVIQGTAATTASRGSLIMNRATNETYLATTSGSTSTTVWHKNLPYSFPSEGYLTLSSDATNPILTGDSLAATTLYYTAFRGDQFWVYNGVSFVPVTITGGQMSLPLIAGSQAANGIYDVLGFLSTTGVPRIAFSPAWSTATAGSGARGTGAGTPQLARVNGILVNAVQQTVNNGSNTFTVAANRGTLLGSVAIDGTAGQITCHVSYGQNRKWGVSNAYNRQPIAMQVGDSTSSWTYSGSAFRGSNNTTANAGITLCCLPEEPISVIFSQFIYVTDGIGLIGIGVNSTTVASGFRAQVNSPSGAVGAIGGSAPARHVIPPALGTQRISCVEADSSSGSTTYNGNNSSMMMGIFWNG